ncbi:CTP synthase-like protein isoform X1 [Cinnamomum micranthum f. kanehirae]|uniref:CTP synthase n=1 Tax=Cinnamomum micranthum f. kanehirae TaxID=337451 RepID=A0A443PEF0_9MAGN|nr:CTP synthase-like protein isoform X1 [Cinnamomum micranthum f. kanehirae]
MKYILVTGGVVSGLGKGVTASSIGLLLKACGLRVTSIKIDPYLNTDAGTMSPCEHGEVFVLDDGGEVQLVQQYRTTGFTFTYQSLDGTSVDLDLGNYERFLDIKLTCDNNITAGKIYQSVIDKERKGDYLGRTVQVVPHITDAIQEWIERVAVIPVDGKDGPPDVCVIELGGTIGDIESMPFIEALGQFSYRVGKEFLHAILLVPDVFEISLLLIINIFVRGRELLSGSCQSCACIGRSWGTGTGRKCERKTLTILPCPGNATGDKNICDCLYARKILPINIGNANQLKIMVLQAANIITLYDVSNIWHIPILLKDQKAHEAILKQLNLLGVSKEPILEEWTSRAQLCDMLHDPVRIAIVGKYTSLPDAYLSVLKALLHASIACRKKLIVDWVSATDLEATTAKEAPDVHRSAWNLLKGADGVLVPGGFGCRGVEGKILAAKYARENGVPFFGICLGMQIAVIEFTRSVLGLQDANSTEFNLDTKNPCVIFMPEGSKTHMGGTMRVGSRRTYFQVHNCRSAKLYGNVDYVDERHRHRYEVNPDMIQQLEDAGISFVGKDETGTRMEILELPRHPYFVGVQFHPEFKSRPGKPSALFLGFIEAASGQLASVMQTPTRIGKVTAKQCPKQWNIERKA